MIYKKTTRIPSTDKVTNHFVSPCVKCGHDDIEIDEYEDQYGFISTAKCKKCKSEIKHNTSEVGIITEWNKRNHIPALLKSKKALIARTEKEIAALKLLQTKRKI